MKKSTLPTQGELARLAAVVLSNAAVNPAAFDIVSHVKHAVKAAALLWLYAGEHCQALMQAENPEKLWFISGDSERGIEVRDASQMAELRAKPERQALKVGTCYADSEVFKWLAEHAPTCDQFIARKPFIHAVVKAFPDRQIEESAFDTVAPIFLREFIAQRKAMRTAARQTRRKRAKADQEKSLADKKLGYAEKAFAVQAKRRTTGVPKRTK